MKELCDGVQAGDINKDTVKIVRRETYRRTDVGRYECTACGRCALINAVTMDDPERHRNLASELRRAMFCEAAIEVAPFNEGVLVAVQSGSTCDVLQQAQLD